MFATTWDSNVRTLETLPDHGDVRGPLLTGLVAPIRRTRADAGKVECPTTRSHLFAEGPPMQEGRPSAGPAPAEEVYARQLCTLDHFLEKKRQVMRLALPILGDSCLQTREHLECVAFINLLLVGWVEGGGIDVTLCIIEIESGLRINPLHRPHHF
jgi:hypothetical protein